MPRKDRTFTHSDLTRFACHNLGSEEQAKVVHNLIDSDCFPIEFTTDQVEKIISCQAVQALRAAIEAFTMKWGALIFLAAQLPLLRALMRLFTWLVRIVARLERLFDRIGVVKKYLESRVVCTFMRK